MLKIRSFSSRPYRSKAASAGSRRSRSTASGSCAKIARARGRSTVIWCSPCSEIVNVAAPIISSTISRRHRERVSLTRKTNATIAESHEKSVSIAGYL